MTTNRWYIQLLVPLLLAAGCRQYGGRTGNFSVDAGYWTADINTAAARYQGGDMVNLCADTGMSDEDDTFFATVYYSQGTNMELYGLGYGRLSTSGQATLAADLTFGGTLFAASSTVHSSLKLDSYQLIIGNRAPEQQAMTIYSFVIQYMDFNVELYDVAAPATRAAFDDTAYLFLLGLAYEWSAGGGTMYFVDMKWMDMNKLIRIGRTGGEYFDVYAGVKWAVGGPTSNLIVAYRYLDMDITMSGNALKNNVEGVVLGFATRF